MLDSVNGNKKLKNTIVGAIRRVWHRAPQRIAVLQEQRREIQEYKKDGSPKLRKSIFYVCEYCNMLCKSQKSPNYPRAHVDHINPVIPIDGTSLTWDQFISNIFCDPDNLQVLCTDCHNTKTQEENNNRRKHKDIRKGE